jgi:hypothetical protein
MRVPHILPTSLDNYDASMVAQGKQRGEVRGGGMGRREEKLNYRDQSLRAAVVVVAYQHSYCSSKRGSLHSHGGIFVDSSWCSWRGIWSGNISRLCDDGE